MNACMAVAPSSTANLGPGYDVFGLGLDPLSDTVKIEKRPGISNRITIKVFGDRRGNIPPDAESNSAGLVIKRMAEEFAIKNDLSVTIKKGIPSGSGLGSSAASAAAAAVAFDRLFGLGLEKPKLIEYAAEGELASAGIRHYDNVSASVLGGFVIVRTDPKLDFIRIAPPKNLLLVVAIPLIEVPDRKTEFARSVLPKKVPLRSMVHNVSNASTIVAGFVLNDVEMIARGINDIVIEPSRKHLIPGYDEVKRRALEAGALAVTISGAGPTMISLLKTAKDAYSVAKAMARGFKEANVRSRSYVCRPSRGAHVVKG